MKFIKSFYQDINGVAAIEFALIAPIVMFLMIGTVDFGMYIKEKMKMEQMARAAVEYVLQGGLEENIENDVIHYYDETNIYTITAQRLCTCSDGVMLTCGNEACAAGDYSRQFIQVDLNKSFIPLFSYPGVVDEITLQGSARMRYD